VAKYLVTGGAGFIGSHLVEELLRRGETVRVADNFYSGLRSNIPADVELIEGDLADPTIAGRAVSGMDYVLHQAAIPSVGKSVLDPLTSHRANVDGTLNVLLAARDNQVKRVIFAGSSSEYGDSPTLPKHEAMPLAPKSPYALQKVMGEEYCRLFTQLYNLETVSIRYFNVFGPRQQPNSPYSGVISLFIKALSNGQPPLILGDGKQTRDFTYIANVVDGVLRACTAPNASGEAINVATNGRVSLLELLDTLNKIMGTSIKPTFGPPREGDVRDSQASIEKAERLLGFTPVVGFEEGLRRTVSATAAASVK
jgi:nucleoside-diphosphate-sugar epimerase